MIKKSIILVSLLSVRIWIPSLSTIKSQTANTINNPLNSLVLFWFWLTVTTFQLSNYLHHERVLDFITYACGSDRYFGDINCILCTINNKRSKSKFSTNETCAHPGLSDNATHCKTTNITTNRWNICFYICWPFFFFFRWPCSVHIWKFVKLGIFCSTHSTCANLTPESIQSLLRFQNRGVANRWSSLKSWSITAKRLFIGVNLVPGLSPSPRMEEYERKLGRTLHWRHRCRMAKLSV